MAGGFDLRAAALRGFVLLMAASTLNALRLLATRGPEVAAAFPGGGDVMRPLSVALALGLLASYVGLWRWRRWGIWVAMAKPSARVRTVAKTLALVARAPNIRRNRRQVTSRGSSGSRVTTPAFDPGRRRGRRTAIVRP